MIRLSQVTKRYGGGRPALEGVSFSVEAGEFTFVTGPSGAGKTTLLKIIFGAERADRGQVMVAGRNVTRIRRRELPHLRRGMGFVFQDFKLLPRRSVFENLEFCQRAIGVGAREARRRVYGVLKMVGLAEKQHLLPRLLSGGEQQRVAIARALVNRPAVLLADEPTGNLDSETGRDMMELFRRAHAMGATVVVATHDWTLVGYVGGRVLRLDRGRLVAS
ncbi:MAG: cell division ATP-binding protein FtsE [Nitrospinota bacterium]